MRKIFLVSLVLVFLSGCAVIKTDQKSCVANGECKLIENVEYKGECSYDCFNERTQADPNCDAEWEEYPAGECACVSKKCEYQID